MFHGSAFFSAKTVYTIAASRNNTYREISRGSIAISLCPWLAKGKGFVQYVLHVVKQVLKRTGTSKPRTHQGPCLGCSRGQWEGPCIFLYMILPKVNFKKLSPLLHKLIWTFPQVLKWTNDFWIWRTERTKKITSKTVFAILLNTLFL